MKLEIKGLLVSLTLLSKRELKFLRVSFVMRLFFFGWWELELSMQMDGWSKANQAIFLQCGSGLF